MKKITLTLFCSSIFAAGCLTTPQTDTPKLSFGTPPKGDGLMLGGPLFEDESVTLPKGTNRTWTVTLSNYHHSNVLVSLRNPIVHLTRIRARHPDMPMPYETASGGFSVGNHTLYEELRHCTTHDGRKVTCGCGVKNIVVPIPASLFAEPLEDILLTFSIHIYYYAVGAPAHHSFSTEKTVKVKRE